MAEKNRRAHAKQKKPERFFFAPFPKGEGRPKGGDEKNRIEQADFRTDEINEIIQSEMPFVALINGSVGRDVMRGRPAVLRVPNDRRQSAKRKDEQREPRAGFAQMDSCRWLERKENRPANNLIERGGFAEKTESHRKADDEPVAGFAIRFAPRASRR